MRRAENDFVNSRRILTWSSRSASGSPIGPPKRAGWVMRTGCLGSAWERLSRGSARSSFTSS